jgi:AcrR family transcriptional regulator
MTVAEASKTISARRPHPDQRGRARGKRTRQEQQKQDSRERILEAAKKALTHRPYALMAVEDVIAEAKISRTTFYRHFDSKFAIFRELHKPFSDAIYEVYDRLALHADPSVEQIRDWVESFLSFYRSEKILVLAYAHIYIIEPDFYPIADGMFDTIFRRLGERLPAFRKVQADDNDAMMTKIEAHLLLQDINNFGIEVVIRNWDLDTSKATLILARRIHDFLRTHA